MTDPNLLHVNMSTCTTTCTTFLGKFKEKFPHNNIPHAYYKEL